MRYDPGTANFSRELNLLKDRLNDAAPNQFSVVDPKVTELTFNRQRADDLNVTIPVSSLVRADAVYE